MSLELMMLKFKGAFVQGKFLPYQSGEVSLEKRDPGDQDFLIGLWRETTESLDGAVNAAYRAFRSGVWDMAKARSALPRLQKAYRRRASFLVDCICWETGKTRSEASAELQAALAKFEEILGAGLERLRSTEREDPCAYYRFRPRGVLAILAPFNFPLHLANGNLLAALATGNTVVFKPSEATPFTGQAIAECMAEAGLPPGVFNLVQGGGKLGEALAIHPQVSGVLLVGSDRVGQRLKKITLKQPEKILALELGGKNAAIVCCDGNSPQALVACAQSMLATTGQRCSSLSRLILHESIADIFLRAFLEEIGRWKVGHFSDPESRMGPLISDRARRKFFRYQKFARVIGAEVLLGATIPSISRRGYYVAPSVHLMPTGGQEVRGPYVDDEIFGPDLAVYLFRDLEEAVALHNGTSYGLVASVFTRSSSLYKKFRDTLAVGNLHWNLPTVGASGKLPFGGVKASGNHFPGGAFSPYYCTYVQAMRKA